jgi:amidophosphoribosyltransferase
MCGIFGLFHIDTPVFQSLVDGLTLLQHRGQDSAGIATLFKNKDIYIHKDSGTVNDVFFSGDVLKGNIGIGHVRYSTSGTTDLMEAHPFYVDHEGIALVHNGNITNTAELRESVSSRQDIQTESDSELLLHLFALEFSKTGDIFDSVRTLMYKCRGGFSVLLIIRGIGLVAFRDPFGIRPLCFGYKNGDYAIASESVAIDALDPQFKLIRDVFPGECICINTDGNMTSRIVYEYTSLKPCLFEYIYFARADSVLDGVSVYDSRLKMGQVLAEKIKLEFLNIDVVIPVPETSRISALEIARILNVPYHEGFVKNRYIARTFLLPGQECREKTVRLKLNTIPSLFKNKNVLIVDDSIVRGTTSKQIVQLARQSGAKKIYFASASPPVLYPNIYGIHIPTSEELVAYQRNHFEVAQYIGADYVIYNDLEDVIKSCILPQFETSCFDGVYISGSPFS